MPVSMHKRARWMGPAMIVLAGIVAGAPAGADGRASDDVVEIPEWRSAFETSGVSGTIVLRRLGDRRSFVSDLDTAERGLPPASRPRWKDSFFSLLRKETLKGTSQK